MKQIRQPNVELNGIEYLLLAIQSDPGKSQRHYLRRLYMYQHGCPSYNNGGTNNGYFTSKSYRNVVWYDASSQHSVKYGCWLSVNSMYGSYTGNSYAGYPRYTYRSNCSQMHLTPAGWIRANEARKIIGLEPIRANYIEA